MKTLAVILVLLAAATAPVALADGNVSVRFVVSNNHADPTDGSLSGRGTFTMTGALKDTGKVAVYRTQTGNIDTGNATITLRFAATSTKGKITFIVKVVIKPTHTTSTWKIASGTKAYKGLYGHGLERENANHTVITLTGTVEHPRKPN